MAGECDQRLVRGRTREPMDDVSNGPTATMLVVQTTAHAQRALGGWLVLALRQAAITVVTFGGIIVLSRLLGPSDFALYGYTTISVNLALAVGDFGMAARVIRDDAEPELLRRLFGAQLLGVGLVGSAGAAVVALAPWEPHARIAAALVGVAVVLAALQTLPTAILEQRFAFNQASQIEVAQRTVFTVGAVILALVGASTAAVPAAAVGAGVLGVLAASRAARWKIRPIFGRVRRVFGGFASDWWQGRVATQVAYAAYPVLGGLLFAARDVGFIVLALNITSFSVLLAPLVARATFPAMAASVPSERWDVFRRVFIAFIVLSLPILAAIALLADDLLPTLFGDQWAAAADIVRVTCLATLFGVALTPSLPLLYLLLDPQSVRRTLVAWAVAQWALTPLVALPFGALAPAIVGATAGAVALFRLDRLLWLQTGFSLVLESGRPLIAILAASVVAGAVQLALPGLEGAVAAATTLLIVYALALRSMGLRPSPRHLIRSLAGGLRTADR